MSEEMTKDLISKSNCFFIAQSGDVVVQSGLWYNVYPLGGIIVTSEPIGLKHVPIDQSQCSI